MDADRRDTLSIVSSTDNGEMANVSEYKKTYNRKGQILTQTEYTCNVDNRIIKNYKEYVYNDNRKIECIKNFYYLDGIKIPETTDSICYNDKRLMIGCHHIGYEDHRPVESAFSIYTYNKKDKMIKIMNYDYYINKPVLSSQNKFSYDRQGRLVNSLYTNFAHPNAPEEQEEYFYNNSGNRVYMEHSIISRGNREFQYAETTIYDPNILSCNVMRLQCEPINQQVETIGIENNKKMFHCRIYSNNYGNSEIHYYYSKLLKQ